MSDRERGRDRERSARRADRLAERAERRARRKEEYAKRASDRAERLAERVRRRPSRERDVEQSIEDIVDDVAERWTRKAEQWFDEQSSRLYTDKMSDDDYESASASARRARREADRLREEADTAHTSDRKRSRRRSRAQSYRSGDFSAAADGWGDRVRRSRRRRRKGGNLYRDSRRGKICGVCAGIADYFGWQNWQVRLAAIMGLFFIPQLTLPLYFGMYFLMDDKPYYRRVTDRFDEVIEDMVEPEPKSGRQPNVRRRGSEMTGMNNVQAMRTAKEKFSGLENRLRAMESHVTSSQFELQRELNRISEDEAS